MNLFRCCITIILLSTTLLHAQNVRLEIEKDQIILTDNPSNLKFYLKDNEDNILKIDTILTVSGDMGSGELQFSQGVAQVENIIFKDSGHHFISFKEISQSFTLRVIPGWLSLLPPLLAIVLALISRQVLIALLVGVWIGATIIYDYNPFIGLLNTLTEYIGTAPADPDKMAIIIFSLVLGGMVGVISKMGGTQGIVESLTKYASNSRRGQFVTWIMGVLIFFDDYANTLIVGNTMRPLTDKLKISREKLSYLVDSTAAPVANIAIISTWIGFELSLIGASFLALGITDNAYITFFKTIPFNFYPIFSLVLGLSIALSGRDFSTMLSAEKRAFKTGAILRPGSTPLSSLDTDEISADVDVKKKWYNGLIPVAVVILTTLIGLWFTGLANVQASGTDTENLGFITYVSKVVGESDSYSVLMWASFFGSFIAIIMAISQKLLSLDGALKAWVGGIKAMLIAALILTLAWSIGKICVDLKTADYIINISKDLLSPHFIPLLSFLIAALISFATGTSWGVMAILMPIVIPMAYLIPQGDPAITAFQQQAIFLSSIASVLAGATFGDHCSPISDTTIMSSMASGADHIDHVKTQLPYALFGGFTSIIFGYIPAGFGINPLYSLISGMVVIIVFVRYVGKKAQ